MKQVGFGGAAMAFALLLSAATVANAATVTVFGGDGGDPGSNTSTASGGAVAMDNGQAFLVYGNMVQSTCTATQNINGTVSVSVVNGNWDSGASNSSMTSSTVTNGSGMSVGSAVVQFNNSATAIVVGGNYSNSSSSAQ